MLDMGQVHDRWRSFLRFQIERNRRLYAEANPGIALLMVNDLKSHGILNARMGN